MLLARSEESRSSIWEPETTVVAPPRPAPTHDPDFDALLLEILDGPARPGETIALAYKRKEATLGALFATLGVIASRAMHARLASPRPHDELAMRFQARLTTERRDRLLTFLAEARRREALSARRR